MTRPEAIECVLFDFDGVIADTEPLGLELDQEAYRALGLDVSIEDAMRIIGTDGVGVVSQILAEYGRPDLGPQDFRAHHRKLDIIYARLLEEPMKGAREVLIRLRELPVHVGLVSTTIARNLLFALDRLGLLSYFDAIVAGDMVERLKPAPDPWLTAMRLLGAAPETTVAIDDSPTGIASAHAAGLYVVGFKGGSIVQDTSSANEELDGFDHLSLEEIVFDYIPGER